MIPLTVFRLGKYDISVYGYYHQGIHWHHRKSEAKECKHDAASISYHPTSVKSRHSNIRVAEHWYSCVNSMKRMTSCLAHVGAFTLADLFGGARDASPPAQNVFIFMQFSGKKGQIIGWRPLENSGSATASCILAKDSWNVWCLFRSYVHLTIGP